MMAKIISVRRCLLGGIFLVWVFSEGALRAEDAVKVAAPAVQEKVAEMDDDFGAAPVKKKAVEQDDDFGDAPAKMAKDDDFGDEELSEIKAEEGEKKKPKKKVYADAAEAHLTFLKVLETEKRYPSAVTCAACHPDHYREWSVSAHAYSQLSPVFNTMQAALTTLTAGTNGDFCIRCHTQIGMQRNEPLFTSNLKRHPASVEGITCIVCHRVGKNYGKVSGRTSINQGSIFEPVYGPQGDKILKETLKRPELAKKLNAVPVKEGEEKRIGKKDIHAEVIKFDPIAKSGFCGTCHDVNLYNGFRLEEAFSQYKNSPAAAKKETCQDCHMGKVPGAVASGIVKLEDPAKFELLNYLRGSGARIGGDVWAKKDDDASGQYGVATPERKRTNHMFVGPDYSIVHPALFPQSKDLRQAMWEYEREIPGTGKFERVSMKHLIKFEWESGWGDPESDFEKAVVKDAKKEKALPWPWNDSIARLTLREQLNSSFKLLNEINHQRHQILRRALRFGEFKVSKNDASGIKFALQIVNATDGHAVPTGFDAERLMFLNVVVEDKHGRVVFESGDRDPNGDVRDLHSVFVHHHAKKTGKDLAKSQWKQALGLKFQKEDSKWLLDKQLFSLQSKFLTRNHRGGEREQVLAVNFSVDPLPYIRPDTRPGILTARPAGSRKQARGIPPLGSLWAKYKIGKDQLTGDAPYTVRFKLISQMVPINLIKAIAGSGFDYDLSAREVAKRIVFGHRTSTSKLDSSRRGGSLIIWDKKIELKAAPFELNLQQSEKDIMKAVDGPFPYKDPGIFGGIDDSGGGIGIPDPELPEKAGDLKKNALLPKPTKGKEDDSFE